MFGFQVQVGKTLVVPQHHIEPRPVLLDEIVFKQQRLGLGIRDRDFHVRRFGEQRLHLRLNVAGLKVGSDPVLQVSRLADVEDLAVRIQHPVDARTTGEAIDEYLGIERSRRRLDVGVHCPIAKLGDCARARARPITDSNISVVSLRVCVL